MVVSRCYLVVKLFKDCYFSASARGSWPVFYLVAYHVSFSARYFPNQGGEFRKVVYLGVPCPCLCAWKWSHPTIRQNKKRSFSWRQIGVTLSDRVSDRWRHGVRYVASFVGVSFYHPPTVWLCGYSVSTAGWCELGGVMMWCHPLSCFPFLVASK